MEEKKANAQMLLEKKQKEKEAREALILRPGSEIFQDEKYKKFKATKFDEQGIPTENEKGPFPPMVRGKFEKDFEKHEKARLALIEKKKQ